MDELIPRLDELTRKSQMLVLLSFAMVILKHREKQ
jgi:hypothetical protein